MKHIHFFLSFVLIFSTNILIASSPARPGPTFGNTGVITLCVNGSYYLNPSTTLGTFSSIDPLIATVNASGYVTGVSLGTTTVSLVATEGGTVTATVTVVASLSPSLSITDPLAQSSYKFNYNPQGPIGGLNNYIGYNGYNYSSQARPTNTGFFRASNQLGDAAGCPFEYDIFRCTTCETGPVNTIHFVGESYGGGIVAYIFQNGEAGYIDGQQHGLVATVEDISTGAAWGCQETSISTSTAIGSGNQNTINIMAGCGEAGIAARLCSDLDQGGYSDWYLPSQDELNKLYINRIAIRGFADGFYWSSTQINRWDAWLQHFNDGLQTNAGKASAGLTVFVRAIRSF